MNRFVGMLVLLMVSCSLTLAKGSMYDSMITDRKIDLVVERNGQTQKLHYEVK